MFIDQISDLPSSEKSVVLLSSLLFETDLLSEVFASRSTFLMLPPTSNPILHNQ